MKKKDIDLDHRSASPLYEQLANKILHRIRVGDYPAGQPLPSINALEQIVNASRITVVRALKELVAMGAISSQGSRGYFVNLKAEPVLVGLVVPLHTVFMSINGKLHAALQLAVRRRYGSLLVAPSEEDPRIFRDRLREMAFGRGIRKLAVVPPADKGYGVHPGCVATLREIAALPGMRMVVMDRDAQPEGYAVIRQNFRAGYRQAAAFLAGRGYRKILFLGAAPDIELALQDLSGKLPGAEAIYRSTDRLAPQDIVEQTLLVGADALVISDFHAAMLLECVGSVPFGLVGYNNSDFVDACPVRMTCVDSNLREMGRAAFTLLESGRTDVLQFIEPVLRPGDTTPPLASGTTDEHR
jgi:DNA-binding transcriptional regulator YhcF (GntR family)